MTATTTKFELPSGVRAAAKARQLIREAGVPFDDAELLDRSELLVSELVTNAVIHGTPPVTLTIQVSNDCLRVSVGDKSADQPFVRHPRSLDPFGRGVALVDAISSDWGVEVRDDGKFVWFVLR